MAAGGQYRDQLTEWNALLLMIYQYMDKILGVDKTPVSVAPVTRVHPSNTTPNRRRRMDKFDKRVKEAEARYTDKLQDMRKQLDLHWKQIGQIRS